MMRRKHDKANREAAEGGARVKTPERRMVTAIGYPLAFAALCALACGPGYAMAAEAASGSSSGEGSSSSSSAIESNQASNAPVASSKDETVYVFAKADGSVKNVEVSDKLTNAGKSSELADSTTLTNIENVEGEGSYRGSGDSIVWDAQGDDVYYRGDSDADLPISMSVTYKLDGRTVNADDLAGKSGKVEMTYRFTNGTKAEGGVQVPLAAITGMLFSNDNFSDIEIDNGKVIDDGDRVVVVGYAMPGLAASLDVDSDTIDIPESFTVTANATDFKLSSTLTMVTGNLFDSVSMNDLDSGELSDSSSSLKDAMSQLTDGSGSLADGLQTLSGGVGSLADGLGQLDGGASSLAEGLGALADGTGSLAKGASALKDGTSDLSDGADTLASGTAKLKKEGTQALADGASELAEQTSALPDASAVKTAKQGSEQISAGFDGLKGGLAKLKGDASSGTGLAYAAAAQHQLASGLSSASSLSDVVSELKSGLKDLSDALGAADGLLDGALSDEKDAAVQVGTAYATLAGIDASTLSAADQAKLNAAIAALGTASTKLGNETSGALYETGAAQKYVEGASDGVSKIASEAGKMDTSSLARAATAANQIASGLDSAVAGIGSATDTSDETLYGGVNSLAAGYDTFSSQVMPLVEGAPTLKAAISQIDAGAKAVNKQMANVESGANSLANGASKVKDGADSLASGAGKIDSGAASAAKGADSLAEGAKSANGGAGKLADGAGSAVEGAKKLADGIGRFNSEGISKIVDLIDNKLVKTADHFDALQAAGKSYDNFSGIAEGTKGTVKFVIETDAIEAGD